MTYIFYYNILNFTDKFHSCLRKLPAVLMPPLLRYRNRQDAERSLAGKLLLQEGLKIIGFHDYTISDLKYSAYQRPCFEQGVDFNIAHSGNYAICAISKTQKVGIDIEEVKPTVLHDFHHYFTKREWSAIMDSDNSLQDFYTLWTQKEAIIKASGEGLSIPLKDIFIHNHQAILGENKWYLFPLQINPAYVSYLATDHNSSAMAIRQLFFD